MALKRKNMKELYRSFEGKLGVDTRAGYIIFDNGTKDTYTLEWLSVYNYEPDVTYRVAKNRMPDFDDMDAIMELIEEINHEREEAEAERAYRRAHR